MSITAQYNPLRFHASRAERQFESTKNKKFIVTYAMTLVEAGYSCVVPPFSLLMASAPTDPPPTFAMSVKDMDGVVMFTSSTFSYVNNGAYTQITYLGSTVTNSLAGFYEIVVTINSVPYYSDVFKWCYNLDELLKVTASSSKIRLMRSLDYEMIYTTHEFYLSATVSDTNSYLKEDATDDDAIISTLHGSSSIIRSLIILGTESIYIFLRGLRILRCNGSVSVVWNYKTYSIDDIVVEPEKNHGGADLLNIKFEFKCPNETISVSNG